VKRARELLDKGLNEKEALHRVKFKFMPPSIVWEAIKKAEKVWVMM
jgi:hypothetical protein